MRKLALLLAVMLLLSMTACQKQPAGNADPTTPTTTAPYTPTRVDTFTVGTVNGTSYENAFFGIGCNLGSDWTIDNATMSTPSLNGQADVNAAAAAAQEFTDMSAIGSVGYLRIGVENMALLTDPGATADDFIEGKRASYEANPELVIEDISATIGTLTCKGLKITVDENLTDVSYYIPCGKYFITLCFQVADPTVVDQLLPLFYTF